MADESTVSREPTSILVVPLSYATSGVPRSLYVAMTADGRHWAFNAYRATAVQNVRQQRASGLLRPPAAFEKECQWYGVTPEQVHDAIDQAEVESEPEETNA